MDSREELNKLCKLIKDHLPSKELHDDSTEQFKEFTNYLKKNVKQYEIDCIIRGYNYFNHILLNDPDGAPHVIARRESIRESIRESVRESLTDTGTDTGDQVQSPLTFEEQIQLLVQLYPIYTNMDPINAMRILAEHVLTKIPDIDVKWIKDPPQPKDSNTIVGRLSYQVEIAKQLEKFVPCQQLIKETENVLKTAIGYENIKGYSTFNPAQEKTAKEKVKILMESAQEKVKNEIEKLSLPKGVP